MTRQLMLHACRVSIAAYREMCKRRMIGKAAGEPEGVKFVLNGVISEYREFVGSILAGNSRR